MPRFGEKRDEGCFVRTRHRTENDAGTKARICHYIFTIKEARNMKKFFALLLAAMMVFVFVSCGDTQGDETTNPSDATETTDTTGPADTTNTRIRRSRLTLPIPPPIQKRPIPQARQSRNRNPPSFRGVRGL